VWDAHLDTAIADWNNPTAFGWNGAAPVHLIEDPGGTNTSCTPTSGKIEVCAANYGDNGWLGIAQIWAKRDHIYQATAKMNDWYFVNDVAWYQRNFPSDWQAVLAADRQNVMCQEIAHDFGLDHQDENFYNTDLNTCMDYVWDPRGDEHPNRHDFEQLATIYNHTDTTKTPGGKGTATGNHPSEWGQVIANDAQGRPSQYRKVLDADQKDEVITHVIWARDAQAPTVDDGTGDGGGNDGGKNDGGKKGDGKKDGGKRDGNKQRQRNHDRHNH
jgi:hypothetical protein